jgi:hypothetical protein
VGSSFEDDALLFVHSTFSYTYREQLSIMNSKKFVHCSTSFTWRECYKK